MAQIPRNQVIPQHMILKLIEKIKKQVDEQIIPMSAGIYSQEKLVDRLKAIPNPQLVSYDDPIFFDLIEVNKGHSPLQCPKCDQSLAKNKKVFKCMFCGAWICSNCASVRKRLHPRSKDLNGNRFDICVFCDNKYLLLQLQHNYCETRKIFEESIKKIKKDCEPITNQIQSFRQSKSSLTQSKRKTTIRISILKKQQMQMNKAILKLQKQKEEQIEKQKTLSQRLKVKRQERQRKVSEDQEREIQQRQKQQSEDQERRRKIQEIERQQLQKQEEYERQERERQEKENRQREEREKQENQRKQRYERERQERQRQRQQKQRKKIEKKERERLEKERQERQRQKRQRQERQRQERQRQERQRQERQRQERQRQEKERQEKENQQRQKRKKYEIQERRRYQMEQKAKQQKYEEEEQVVSQAYKDSRQEWFRQSYTNSEGQNEIKSSASILKTNDNEGRAAQTEKDQQRNVRRQAIQTEKLREILKDTVSNEKQLKQAKQLLFRSLKQQVQWKNEQETQMPLDNKPKCSCLIY